MKKLDRTEAEKIFDEAIQMHNGSWVNHTKHVACLAEVVAKQYGLDPERAYVFGLMHDIGRREGRMRARHIISGYKYMMSLGYAEEAKICMTHTFQYQDVNGIYDEWDCNEADHDFVKSYLKEIKYDDYDKLIQLCDALSLKDKYCIMEEKMVASVMRYGYGQMVRPKWQAIMGLKAYFDEKLGKDIYSLFDEANSLYQKM